MENQNKYQNGKIYKIVDIGYNKCYIGSTTEELSMRMARHRSNFKRFLRGDKESHIRSFDLFHEYGVENCKIELIEYFKCDTLQELQRKEGEHIKNTECVNKCVAGRTDEHYDDNKNKISERNKEYKQDNKDKILEQKKEYYQNNKDKIKEYKKEYCEANKDKIREQKKKYREANKDKIKEHDKLRYAENKEKNKSVKRNMKLIREDK